MMVSTSKNYIVRSVGLADTSSGEIPSIYSLAEVRSNVYENVPLDSIEDFGIVQEVSAHNLSELVNRAVFSEKHMTYDPNKDRMFTLSSDSIRGSALHRALTQSEIEELKSRLSEESRTSERMSLAASFT